MTTLEWPELYFIRHGETPWNAEKRYQGQRDIQLNARGQAQADANGHILRALLEHRHIDPMTLGWHVSPLGRARESMERVRAAFPGPLPPAEIDPRLIEISFGELEGLLHDELPERIAVAPGNRDADYWHFRPAGGENYTDVEARLTEFSMVLKGPSVVVAHGGIARTLRVLIEHAPIAEVINWAPPQDVVMHFTEGKLELIGAGDV